MTVIHVDTIKKSFVFLFIFSGNVSYRILTDYGILFQDPNYLEATSVVFEKINFLDEKMRFVKGLLIGGENKDHSDV